MCVPEHASASSNRAPHRVIGQSASRAVRSPIRAGIVLRLHRAQPPHDLVRPARSVTVPEFRCRRRRSNTCADRSQEQRRRSLKNVCISARHSSSLIPDDVEAVIVTGSSPPRMIADRPRRCAARPRRRPASQSAHGPAHPRIRHRFDGHHEGGADQAVVADVPGRLTDARRFPRAPSGRRW